MTRTETEPTGAESPDQGNEPTKAHKSRRPPNTAFRQQRLKAWQPILTPKTVLPLFFAIGVIFAPIGGLLLYASEKVQELSIEYQDCTENAPAYPEFATIPDKYVSASFKNKTSAGQQPQWSRNQTYNLFGAREPYSNITTRACILQFTLPDDLAPPVLLYYRLTNFYQNHRRYVKSFDQDQLSGSARSNSSISGSDCDPLEIDSATNKSYYPCGLIANSLFNDTIMAPVALNAAGSNANNVTYHMTNNNIAWDSDKDLYKMTKYTYDQVVPPVNWRLRYPVYNESFPFPDLHTWEEFQVWMRTAALPSFSKLALRNDTAMMASGTYQMTIYDYFPVLPYSGTKGILISTRTVMGGKNPFLGIAYVVVAGLCVLLGVIFTATHLIKPRKLGDHSYLSWNNDQPSTATTTGREIRPGA